MSEMRRWAEKFVRFRKEIATDALLDEDGGAPWELVFDSLADAILADTEPAKGPSCGGNLPDYTATEEQTQDPHNPPQGPIRDDMRSEAREPDGWVQWLDPIEPGCFRDVVVSGERDFGAYFTTPVYLGTPGPDREAEIRADERRKVVEQVRDGWTRTTAAALADEGDATLTEACAELEGLISRLAPQCKYLRDGEYCGDIPGCLAPGCLLFPTDEQESPNRSDEP